MIMENQYENLNPKEVEVRGNGTQVFTEPYSKEGIARLKNLVMAFYDQGENKYFSIAIDGETVVHRTCDGRKFDLHEKFISQHSQHIEVKMYQGLGPNCNKYQFTISRGLSGTGQIMDQQRQIEKAKEEERMKIELDSTKKELKEAKELLEKKSKKLKKLKGEMPTGAETIEKLAGTLSGVISTIASARNPALAGTPQPQAEVKIERESEAEIEENEQEEDEPKSLQTYNSIVEKYGEDQVNKAFSWLIAISENPDLMEKFKDELNKKKNANGQA